MAMPFRSAKRKRGDLGRTFDDSSSEFSESGTSGSSFKVSDSGEDTDSSGDGLNDEVDLVASKGISGGKKVVRENPRSSSTLQVKKGKTRLKKRKIQKKKDNNFNCSESERKNLQQVTKGESSAVGVIQRRKQEYDKQTIEQAIEGLEEGASSSAVSEELSVPRGILGHWHKNYTSGNKKKELRKQRLSKFYGNETVQEVCKLMREGAKTAVLAKQYDIPFNKIVSWRRKFVPESLGETNRYSNDTKLEIIRRLKNGERIGKIVGETKISVKTIFAWRKKFLKKIQVTTAEGTWEYDEYTKVEACNRLKHQGAKLENVAKELNVHISVLRNWNVEEDFGLTSQVKDQRNYSKDFIISVCKRLRQGESAGGISKKLGINRAWVNVWKQRYCSSETPKPADTLKFDKKTVHQACELLKSGEKAIDVSRKLQVSTSTLRRWRRLYLEERPEYHSFGTVLNLVKEFQYYMRKNILEIYKLLNQGDTLEAVAKKLNLTFLRVQELRSKYLVKGESTKDTSDYADGIIQQVHERFRHGTLLRSISKEFGINLQTVNYWHCKYLEKVSTKFLKKVNNVHNRRDVKLESLPIVVLEKDPKLDQLCQSRNFIPFKRPLDSNSTIIKQVCKRLREGASLASVAKEVGVHSSRVLLWRDKYIPKEERITRKSRLFSNEEVMEACRLLKKGATIGSLAKRYGVTKRTIADWQSKVDISETPNLVLRHNACDVDVILQAFADC